MAESSVHISFVEKIHEEAKKIIPFGSHVLIDIDHPNSSSSTPKLLNGYKPDLYYCYDNLLVIGEAKTDFDVERPHSMNQYISYYDEAYKFSGQAVLIFCVSWKMFATMKNIMRRIRRNKVSSKIRIIVLNDLREATEIWVI